MLGSKQFILLIFVGFCLCKNGFDSPTFVGSSNTVSDARQGDKLTSNDGDEAGKETVAEATESTTEVTEKSTEIKNPETTESPTTWFEFAADSLTKLLPVCDARLFLPCGLHDEMKNGPILTSHFMNSQVDEICRSESTQLEFMKKLRCVLKVIGSPDCHTQNSSSLFFRQFIDADRIADALDYLCQSQDQFERLVSCVDKKMTIGSIQKVVVCYNQAVDEIKDDMGDDDQFLAANLDQVICRSIVGLIRCVNPDAIACDESDLSFFRFLSYKSLPPKCDLWSTATRPSWIFCLLIVQILILLLQN